MKKRKVFIVLSPDQNAPGGVSSFCRTLKKYISSDFYFFHRRSNSYPPKKSLLKIIIDQMINIKNFFILFISNIHIKAVLINVSLSKQSLFREVFYVLICNMFFKPTIIFFHGWQKTDIEFLRQKGKFLLRFVLLKCKHIFVLAETFKDDLISLGISTPVSITTTMFDDSDLIKPNEASILAKYSDEKKRYQIIFLSRIEREKGIYESIDVIRWLNNYQKNYLFVLNVIGDGTEFNNVIKYKDDNIIFHGYKHGLDKYNLLNKGDLLLFPTYDEGFPIVITEAMACGLPIFTRPVGGIKDFFSPEMGYCSDSLDPVVIGKAILDKINKNELCKIALFNYKYAWDNLAASAYVRKFELKINNILTSD